MPRFDALLGALRETDDKFSSAGFTMWSNDDTVLWQVQLNAAGVWVFTDITPTTPSSSGQSMGLLLTLTYS